MNQRGTLSNPFRILVAEDNPGDADLLIEAFNRLETHTSLFVARDGEEAVAFLRQIAPHIDAPRVDLIILDLNLPLMNGREVLEIIKNDIPLLHLPIIVFSSSSARHDVVDTYRLYANAFMTKPVDLATYFALAGAIESYWLRTVRIPDRLG